MRLPAISCQSPKRFSKEKHYQAAEYNNGQSDCVIDHDRCYKSLGEGPSSEKLRHSVHPDISESRDSSVNWLKRSVNRVSEFHPTICLWSPRCHMLQNHSDETFKPTHMKHDGVWTSYHSRYIKAVLHIRHLLSTVI